ncbi:transient receptor potential channel pyrexia-like isoform X2 [Artemia franciscana]|uniref:transient receptor potential channel pyrexia-like isoform X2 n=1 Tax=Artemia franciscana TaxID=6661 RepID=UPI0032DA81C9
MHKMVGRENQTTENRKRSTASSWSERRKNWREQKQTISITSEASYTNDELEESQGHGGTIKSQSICGIFSNSEIEKGILSSDGISTNKHEEELEIFRCSFSGEIHRVMNVLRDCCPTRKPILMNVGVLAAVWHGNYKLLRLLVENGGNVNSKDRAGRTAVHLAAISNSVSCLQILSAKGAFIDEWDYENTATPLGSAAASKNVEALDFLLSKGADSNAGLSDYSKAGCTPLNWAARASAITCLQSLINHGAKVNSPHAYMESPLHISASLGDSKCLEILLKSDADVRMLCGSNKLTALHLAAEDGAPDCVRLLLSFGADPNIGNIRNQTPLHMAALAQACEVVSLLVKGGAKVDAEDMDRKTPLHNAIVKTVRCTETVQNLLLLGANVNHQDKFGYSPLHLAALNEDSALVSLLIHRGADITVKTKGGATALSVISRRTPDCITHLSQRLDEAVSLVDHDSHELDSELKVDLRFLVPRQKAGESQFFMALIQSGQRTLLQHPVCRAFLYLKWFRIRKLFFISLLFYALFVLFLSLFIVETFVLNPYIQNGYCDPFAPKKCNLPVVGKKFEKHYPHIFCTNGTCPFRARKLDPCNSTSTFTNTPIALEVVWWFLLFLTIIFFIKELFQLFQNPKDYIRNWENWIQILVITFTACSAYGHKTFLPCPEKWQYHTAGLVMVLSWTQMMIVVGRFPSCGLYVQMFHTVAGNVLRFILVYLCMVVGFSLGMAILFPGTPSLNRIPGSLLTTLVMMLGEIDVDILFEEHESKNTFYKGTGHLVFFAFVILIVIVLMNLLVGLAVSDIQGIQRSAGLSRLVRQTRLIDRLEAIVFSPWSNILPTKIQSIIQNGALLVPSAYNCVFSIRPNDPRDIRLPKELKEGIHRVAIVRQRMKNHRFSRLVLSRSFTSNHFTDNLSEDLDDIFQQIQSLNDIQCSVGEKLNEFQDEVMEKVNKALAHEKTLLEELLYRTECLKGIRSNSIRNESEKDDFYSFESKI